MNERSATVVVVTHQARGFIDGCLTALRNQTLPSDRYDVVVVDNASTDGTADWVRRRHPWATVVASGTNDGFGAGCMRGLALCPSKYVVLVNSDAQVSTQFLEAILRPLEDDPTIGATSGHLVLARKFVADTNGPVSTADGRRWRALPLGADSDGAVDIINSTGVEITREGYCYDRSYLSSDAAMDDPADVFAFHGAAAALRSHLLMKLGGFDERYFLYYEDADLSWRMRLQGFRIVYARAARVRHIHQASVGHESAMHTFYDSRNRLVTLAKNASARVVMREWTLFPVATAWAAARGRVDPRVTRIRCNAYLAALRMLPESLSLRRITRADEIHTRQTDWLISRRLSFVDLGKGG